MACRDTVSNRTGRCRCGGVCWPRSPCTSARPRPSTPPSRSAPPPPTPWNSARSAPTGRSPCRG
ncbi:hypothetical protein GCO27_08660 [Corynebacterium sp. zg331]|nr:hypothetical protein [Corynebacterium sp. zg331]